MWLNLTIRAVVALTSAVALSFTSGGVASADLMLQPGMKIVIPNGDGSRSECTAGFVVTTSDPSPAFLTAGHCADRDGIDVYEQFGPGRYSSIGASRVAQLVDPDRVGSLDISLVDMSNRPVQPNPRLTDGTVVAGVSTSDDLRSGNPVLCKIGQVTGKTCGPITQLIGDKVLFSAAAAEGDSGGPVYAVWSDGHATAVAVLTGALTDDRGTAVGQMIAPWLSAWVLRLA